jgi:hypothetical protein
MIEVILQPDLHNISKGMRFSLRTLAAQQQKMHHVWAAVTSIKQLCTVRSDAACSV